MYNYNEQQLLYRIIENAEKYIKKLNTKEKKEKVFNIIYYNCYIKLKEKIDKNDSLLYEKQKDNIHAIIYDIRQNIKSNTN